MFDVRSSLANASKVAMADVMGLKEGETVLIITNPVGDVKEISESLYNAVIELGGSPTLIFQEIKTQLDLAEPSVISAIKSNPDIILSISNVKLGKDSEALKTPYIGEKASYDHVFTYLLGEGKTRSFWSPGVTIDMFEKTVPVDYGEMRRRAGILREKLTSAVSTHITAPGGTDVLVGLRGREASADDGDFTKPGTGGNLPAGETFISPELGTTNGVIAFDGVISLPDGEMMIETPLRATVEKGYVTGLEGGDEADRLRNALKEAEDIPFKMANEGKLPEADADKYSRNTYNIGELGIGLNPKAEIVGNMLEDEKVFRTCHFAIGANYDEDAKAMIHLDGLVNEPTIVLKYEDGTKETVMDNGDLVV